MKLMTDDSRTAFETGFSLVAQRQPVLTAHDVQSSCDHSIPISEVESILRDLASNGSLVSINTTSGSPTTAYVDKNYATRWWIERVLSWHEAGVLVLTKEELACSMSITFGQTLWHEPDRELFKLGIGCGMIAPTERAGSLVSPWVNFLRVVHGARQFLVTAARTSHPYDLLIEGNDSTSLTELLSSLDPRERTVLIERRLRSRTLEEVGEMLSLTRERVRQIENYAIRRYEVRTALVSSLASQFVNNAWSLIINNENNTFEQVFNCLFGAHAHRLELLRSIVLMDVRWIDVLTQILSDRATVLKFAVDGFETIPEALVLPLALLPAADATRIRGAARRSLQHASEKLPRKSQVYVALKILGKAAHYSEVIEVCKSLWPNHSGSNESYINALAASNENGVVHIGRKGMYGLVEHGYTQPTQGLTETVAEIVRDEYLRTGSPVSVDVVFDRTHDYRQYPDKKSVAMALSFNEDLQSVGQSRYVPSEAAANGDRSRASTTSGFDFSSALGRLAGKEDPSEA